MSILKSAYYKAKAHERGYRLCPEGIGWRLSNDDLWVYRYIPTDAAMIAVVDSLPELPEV